MRKKIGIVSMVLVLSLMGITQAFALSDTQESEITISHVDYDSLTDSEKSSIIKDKPKIDVEEDIYNIRLIYSKTKNDGGLPHTGVSAASPLVFVGVLLFSFGLMFIMKKSGKSDLFGLVIVGTIISLGAIGAVNIYADSSIMPKDLVSTVSKNETFTHEPEIIEGYTYQGFIMTSKNNPNEIVEDKEGIVMVNYQDDAGNELMPTTEVKGLIGNPYKIAVEEIPGYEFVKFRGNAEGIFNQEKQEVTVIYKKTDAKIGNVILRYRDTNGNTIRPDLKLTGDIGSVFKVDIPQISKYSFSHIENLGNALFTKDQQVITLIYNKINLEGNVLIKYQDTQGNTLKESITLTGIVGTPYTVLADKIKGYEFVGFIGNETGNFEEESKEIIVQYKKTEPQIGNVTIEYLDENENSIKANTLLSGEVGSLFEVDIPEIDGYMFKNIVNPGDNTFTTENQTITLIYKKLETQGKIIVKYQDTEGNTLKDDVTLTGVVGTPYTVLADKIMDYEFVGFIGNETGNFEEESKEIIVQYKKIEPQIGNVTIEYLDENENFIKANTLLSGEVGSLFEVDIPEIDGYMFKDIVNPGNNTFTAENQTITLIYKKLETQGKIIVKYQDTEGNTLKDAVTLTGVVGESYKVEVPMIEGYQFKEYSGESEGLFEEADSEVIVIYEKEIKYTTTVVKFKHLRNGQPDEDYLAVPDLTQFQTNVIDFSNYYLKFNEPITNQTRTVKYGQTLDSITLENWEFNINELPNKIDLDTYYLNDEGVETESYGSYSKDVNGYIGDGSVLNAGYANFRAELGDVPIITYDEATATVYVTYTCMYIPVIVDF